MRNLFYIAVLAGLSIQTLMTPFIGPIVYYWIAFMALHTQTYATFQPALVIGAAMAMGFLFFRGERSIHWSGTLKLLLVFYVWTTFTTPFARVQPDAAVAWFDWTKVVFVVLMTVALIRQKHQIAALVWVIVICWAYLSAKAGLFVAMYGGKFDISGPQGAYWSNNDFSRPLMISLPFFYFLAVHAASRLVRWGVVVGSIGTMLTLIATNSLGALVGAAAMAAFFVITSRRPFKLVLVGVAVAGLVVAVLPPERIQASFGETQRLNDVDDDTSMATRFRMWGVAMNLAAQNPLTAGGFKVEVWAGRAFHSNYFQVLAEHGYVGLLLYLSMCMAVLVSLTNTVRLTRLRPKLYWARDLALMSRLAVIGYLVGGLTINHAYKDIFYVVVAIAIVLDRFVRQAIANEEAPRVTPERRTALGTTAVAPAAPKPTS